MYFLTFFNRNKINFPKEAVEIHSIGRHWKVFQSQEDTSRYYSLRTGDNFRLKGGTILQYSQYTGSQWSPTPREKKALVHPVLVSEGISNCQVILIKQNNDLWMMHTSPAGISGGFSDPFGMFQPPNPFVQISGELDVNAKTQTVVIPSYRYKLWDKESFLEKTGLKEENTSIEVLTPELFYKEVKPHMEKHHVGYDVDNDRLWIVGGYKDTTAHRYDKVFDEINPSLKRSPIIYSFKESEIKNIVLVEANLLDSEKNENSAALGIHPPFNDLKTKLSQSFNKRNGIDYTLIEKIRVNIPHNAETAKQAGFAVLDGLLRKNKVLTGYYRSKVDLELQKISEEIFINRQHSKFFEKAFPNATKYMKEQIPGNNSFMLKR